MPPRPQPPPTNVLTRSELAELNLRLSRISVTALQDFYHAAHYRCRCDMGYFPNARAIQELVQAWKQLKKGSS
jgi:hypothetical protein